MGFLDFRFDLGSSFHEKMMKIIMYYFSATFVFFNLASFTIVCVLDMGSHFFAFCMFAFMLKKLLKSNQN